MFCRPAGRFIWIVVAASLAAGVGPAAIANSAGNGGAQAPGVPGADGGVEAPEAGGWRAAPADDPEAVFPAGPEPVAPAPEPGEPAEPAEPESTLPGPVVSDIEAPPAEEAPLEAPTSEQALAAAREHLLVPVAVLSAPLEDAAPLIDIAPEPVAALPLAEGAGLAAARAAQDEDDEVVIPVPPEDVDPDDEDAPPDDGTDEPGPGPAPQAAERLPRTGSDLTGPLAAGLVLLWLGVWLRISIIPSGAARARA